MNKSFRATWPIQLSFLANQALQEPFVALYAMLTLIITKNLGATPFQIAVLNMLRPTVSVISFYWGSYLHLHPSLTKPSLIISTLLATLPFLFSFQISDPWIFIGFGAWYALCMRAATPASVEILKWNTEKKDRERLFSQISILAYLIGGLFSIAYGYILDADSGAWTYLFSATAALYITSICIQKKYPAPEMTREILLQSIALVHKESSFTKPWQQAIELVKARRDFFIFQLGFTVAGFGLMFTQPAIPAFLSGLPLSYMELFVAFSLLKGFGFVVTSPIWAKGIATGRIHALSSWVFVGFSLFLLLLVAALFHPIWIFAAYLIYGVAQAGSHLIWNLSGPHFAQDESSTRYSSVNVLMVGLRGAVAPPLGALCAELFGPCITIGAGAILCCIGAKIVLKGGGKFS